MNTNLQPKGCEISGNTCAWHDNHMIQSAHTTSLLRRNFSWIPGKKILNLELLAGGLWCTFLNQHFQSFSAPYLFPACGSLFLNQQHFREAERGKWDDWKKISFSVHFCSCHWPGTWSSSGLGWTPWDEDEPSLSWHWGFTNSSPFIISYPKTLFIPFKTQNRSPVLVDYEFFFFFFFSMSFPAGLCGTANKERKRRKLC